MKSGALPSIPMMVVTGGPGGGKSVALEVVRRYFGGRVEVLPDAGQVVLGGGFPRRPTLAARRAAERAILSVQRELERLADEESTAELVVCQRGTLDALAHCPDPSCSCLAEVGTSRARELARYATVLHVRPPPEAPRLAASKLGRTESPAEALAIDARIERAWDGHPRRIVVESTPRFLDKVACLVELVRRELSPHPLRAIVASSIDAQP